MDADAKENCEEILGLLEDAGMKGVLWDDSAPGVPEGVFEVRVPAADSAGFFVALHEGLFAARGFSPFNIRSMLMSG